MPVRGDENTEIEVSLQYWLTRAFLKGDGMVAKVMDKVRHTNLQEEIFVLEKKMQELQDVLPPDGVYNTPEPEDEESEEEAEPVVVRKRRRVVIEEEEQEQEEQEQEEQEQEEQEQENPEEEEQESEVGELDKMAKFKERMKEVVKRINEMHFEPLPCPQSCNKNMELLEMGENCLQIYDSVNQSVLYKNFFLLLNCFLFFQCQRNLERGELKRVFRSMPVNALRKISALAIAGRNLHILKKYLNVKSALIVALSLGIGNMKKISEDTININILLYKCLERKGDLSFVQTIRIPQNMQDTMDSMDFKEDAED